MTEARRSPERHKIWHRTGPTIAFAMLAVAATAEGCGDDEPSNATTATTSSTGGGGEGNTGNAGPGGGSPGGAGGQGGAAGGAGGTGGTGGATDAAIDAAAEGNKPYDATPDPDAVTIYFTADDPVLGPGVFKVPAAGGSVEAVKNGDPFVAPFGIAIGTAGTQLYIADPASVVGTDDDGDAGQIFTIPSAGGNLTTLPGTEGYVPRGVELVDEGNNDTLYFTGQDPTTGDRGVFKISSTGGQATAVATGAPFLDPAGVTIAPNGDVYVVDTRSAATQRASVLKIASGQSTATEFLTDLVVGYPAGIALNLDGSELVISGLDPATGTDVVIFVDIGSMTQSFWVGDADTDISLFEEPAGLHRAKNVNTFAWADSSAGDGGTVFVITQ